MHNLKCKGKRKRFTRGRRNGFHRSILSIRFVMKTRAQSLKKTNSHQTVFRNVLYYTHQQNLTHVYDTLSSSKTPVTGESYSKDNQHGPR